MGNLEEIAKRNASECTAMHRSARQYTPIGPGRLRGDGLALHRPLRAGGGRLDDRVGAKVAAVNEATSAGGFRGALADIGGRNLRFVLVEAEKPVRAAVILESGAFGFSADWSVVQELLAARGFRSLAYDRAGLGHSWIQAPIRATLVWAVVADLERLLAKPRRNRPVDLLWPFHGRHVRAPIRRQEPRARRGRGAGRRATTPEIMDLKPAAGFVGRLPGEASQLVAWGADNGLLRPLAHAGLGDAIGLFGAAKVEKRWAFAHGPHNHGAAAEVGQWAATAEQARAAGSLRSELPLAVVLAGAQSSRATWKTHLTAPALASRCGSIAYVRGASHASILGVRFGGAGVDAVERVFAAGADC